MNDVRGLLRTYLMTGAEGGGGNKIQDSAPPPPENVKIIVSEGAEPFFLKVYRFKPPAPSLGKFLNTPLFNENR